MSPLATFLCGKVAYSTVLLLLSCIGTPSSALVTEIFGCGMVLLGVAWQLIVRSVSSSRQAGIEVEGREKHGR
jgi:hypothetical protein